MVSSVASLTGYSITLQITRTVKQRPTPPFSTTECGIMQESECIPPEADLYKSATMTVCHGTQVQVFVKQSVLPFSTNDSVNQQSMTGWLNW